MRWIAEALSVKTAAGDERAVKRISTDSREAIGDDTLFIALRGERFDAHDFIPDVYKAGVRAFVVEGTYRPRDCNARFFTVENTLAAYGAIARSYRMRFDIPVIGITGSCGKTTTKELTALFLSTKYTVLKNEGNFNNEIGVPRTIVGLEGHHTACVIEMGMNHAGELTRLSGIARPTSALVTNVEPVHLEYFDSVKAIARAKAEVFSSMITGAPAVINADSPYADILRAEARRYGVHSLMEFSHKDIEVTGEGRFRWNSVEFRHTLPGAFNRMNIIAALTLARMHGIDAEACAQALASFAPAKDRMQIVPVGDSVIINDTYNSNPTALMAMLVELASYDGYERIAVIGDMKELGAQSRALHEAVGRHIDSLPIEAVFTFGDEAVNIIGSITRDMEKRHFTDRNALVDAIRARVSGKAAVLLKASHSMGFSSVCGSVIGR